MKLTLLDLTQNILSSMDSEEINSIGDTVESRQVAEIIKTVYFNIIARANLPEQWGLSKLENSLDPDVPVLMYVPNNISKIEWVKYNKSDKEEIDVPEYQYVTILPVTQFLDLVNRFAIEEDNVERYTFDNFSFYYIDNQHPKYCTIIKDKFVLFDAFRRDLEDTLEASRTLVRAQIHPNFEMSDQFIPELDVKQFPLLLNEAKSLAFLELKQAANELSMLESKRQWKTLQHSKHLSKGNPLDQFAYFGRK